MENHWLSQPGMDSGRARLVWLMLVGDHSQVAELADLGQQRLAGLCGLDLVPRRWLHMTTLIAGFADEITPNQADAIAGNDGELYYEPWTPHITLAYSNAVGPAGPVIEALG